MRQAFTIFVHLILFGLGTTLAQAKWRPMHKAELIETADVILIADYLGYDKVGEIDGMYDQLGSFKVIQELKGQMHPSFTVYGSSREICAPLIHFKELKPGRFLLFLTKRKFGLTDCSGSINPITEGEVLWFTSDSDWGSTLQKLDAVTEEIKARVSAIRISH